MIEPLVGIHALREVATLEVVSRHLIIFREVKFLVRKKKFEAATSNGVTFGWIVSLCSAEVS
jgi:hypothetical protein